MLEQQAREDEQKLAALRNLAFEAFTELDQGQGTAIDGAGQLKQLIGQIGRRAADEVKRRWSEP
jgi:hypothetical protein